jgi:WD40 repeat protein
MDTDDLDFDSAIELGPEDAPPGGDDSDGDGEMADEFVHDADAGGSSEEEALEHVPSGPDASIAAFRAHADSVVCLVASPDGALAACGSVDDAASIFSTADGRAVATLPHVETVSSVAFSSSGRLVATGCYDGIVRLWAVPAAEARGSGGASAAAPVHTLDGPAGDIQFVGFHPRGDVLLAGSSDGTVWMWSVVGKTASCMQVFAGGEGEAAAGGFSRDGKRVLVGYGDGSLRVFNPKSGAAEHAFTGRGWDAPVTSVTQSAAGDLVAVTSMDGCVRVVNVAAWKVVLSVDHNEDAAAAAGPVARAAGNADDEEDVEKTSAEWCVLSTLTEACRARIPSLRRATPLTLTHSTTPPHPPPPPPFPTPPPRSAAFCDTQPWFASGATNGVLVICDTSSFSVRLRIHLRGGCTALQFVPGTALLVAGTANGWVTVIDARDGAVKSERAGHAGPIFNVCVGGDAQSVWTAGDDAVCRKFAIL